MDFIVVQYSVTNNGHKARINFVLKVQFKLIAYEKVCAVSAPILKKVTQLKIQVALTSCQQIPWN